MPGSTVRCIRSSRCYQGSTNVGRDLRLVLHFITPRPRSGPIVSNRIPWHMRSIQPLILSDLLHKRCHWD